jgi:MFS family permease
MQTYFSTSIQRVLVWVAVALAGCVFLTTSFRKGWTQVETDFPNYYTAAVLWRHHQPLQRFYEWPWFQRQMNYAGTERQLGGYIPQTPLTMLPLVPLSGLSPQSAKQAWLALNLIFLAITALLLARLSNRSAGVILLIAFAGYLSLDANFLLGQYYVFLLFMLTLGVWSLLCGRSFTGGFVMGTVCMLKLYSAPFFFYFLWKRQWRALLGMLTACAGLGALSIAWFGWDANVFYLTYVFPRASENAILDPYHPAIGTLTNLLRRTFIMESELNPQPLFNAPIVFFFLRPLLTLSILIIPLLAFPRNAAMNKRELAWFLIAILLSSPNTASYVFILLLLPIAMLLDGANRQWAVTLVVAYILLSLPLYPVYSWLFPKLWILLALFILVGFGYWGNISLRRGLITMFAITLFSVVDAVRHQQSYDREPARKLASVESQPHSIYASNPAVSKAGIVFESLGAGGYVLNRNMAFSGHAFHPSTPASGTPIYFELVARGQSSIKSFDPQTRDLRTIVPDATNPAISSDGNRLAYVSRGRLFIRGEEELSTPGPVDDVAWFPDGTHLVFSAKGVIYDSRDMQRLIANVSGELNEPAVSPNGQSFTFTATRHGIRHVWIEDTTTKTAREITGGACNSYAPAWERNSDSLIFASDCGRGLGLPRLYRAELAARN